MNANAPVEELHGHVTAVEQWRPLRCQRSALVLQGGGALGAYQAGVHQALHEARIEPDWVSGVLIGAMNSALIAGNRPAQGLQKLWEFWELSNPRLPGPWHSHSGAKNATSYYDNTPLRDTLRELVDFFLINAKKLRFSVGRSMCVPATSCISTMSKRKSARNMSWPAARCRISRSYT